MSTLTTIFEDGPKVERIFKQPLQKIEAIAKQLAEITSRTTAMGTPRNQQRKETLQVFLNVYLLLTLIIMFVTIHLFCDVLSISCGGGLEFNPINLIREYN